MPRSRVLAARWVRDNSRPEDVVATNVHCIEGSVTAVPPDCDARSFWLSAYAERSVLVEGWSFAPRVAGVWAPTFWDEGVLRLNDEAFTNPTEAGLRELRERYHVRYLVVDRWVTEESPRLARLTRPCTDDGRMAVYELT
jgi:hypothetical protein